MNHTTKKFLCASLALCMLLSTLPVSALAVDTGAPSTDVSATDENTQDTPQISTETDDETQNDLPSGTFADQNVTWTLEKATETTFRLVVGGNGAVQKPDDWSTCALQSYKDDISSIVIGENITAVEFDLYSNFSTALKDVYFECNAAAPVTSETNGTGGNFQYILYHPLDNLTLHGKDGILRTGTCQNGVTYTIFDDGLLKLSGFAAIDDYDSQIHTPWHDLRPIITDVHLEDGITAIGVRSLASIGKWGSDTLIIPSSVQKVDSLSLSFGKLTSITFNGSVGGHAPEIADDTFMGTESDMIIYYPANNAGWESVINKNYGSEKTVTWVPIGSSITPEDPDTPETPNKPSNKPSSSSSKPSTTTETVTNKDGSKTTTVTNKTTGVVTETTKYPDGSTVEIRTEKNGDTVTTEKRADKVTVVTTTEDGKTTATVSLPKSMPDTVVVIPVDDADICTVPVDAKTSKVIKLSITGRDEVAVAVDNSVTIEIIDNSKNFSDIAKSDWYADAVGFVAAHEIMTGTGADTFTPNSSFSRGMVAQVLYNLDAKSTSGLSGNFTDVTADMWYSDAANWAASQNIISGYPDGTFGANDSITCEQLISILYRYAQAKGYDVSASGNLDAYGNAVSAYAADAMRWAVGAELMQDHPSLVASRNPLTRAEVASIMMRFVELAVK